MTKNSQRDIVSDVGSVRILADVVPEEVEDEMPRRVSGSSDPGKPLFYSYIAGVITGLAIFGAISYYAEKISKAF